MMLKRRTGFRQAPAAPEREVDDMTLSWYPESNGVWAGHFTDALHRPCVLRQSTRSVPVLCLGLDAAGWMHLTREQVNGLLPHLLRFVETGSLREAGTST